MPTNSGDDTCPSCVVAGDYIFLAHHAGGFDKHDIRYQMRAAFESIKNSLTAAGASLNDMAQINLYLKNLDDFNGAREIFYEYFDKGNFPARMTSQTAFLDSNCLCMIDGTAYKPNNSELTSSS
jgi:2-iminobutanoate/2-iminopropanoate deaminase